MSLATQLASSRRQRRKKKSGNLATWSGWGIAAIISVGIAVLLVGLVFGYTRLTAGLPSLETLPLLFEAPNGLLLQPTRLYDRTGEKVILTLMSPAAASRLPIKIAGQPAELQPKALIEATLASQDPTFWQNPGYTLKGLLDGTHSTLAQKLVNEFLLAHETPGLQRNIREGLLAAQIIQRFGREKI